MTLRKLFSLALGLLAISGCTPANQNPEDGNTPPANEETLEIGYIGALTGDIASIGTDDKRALEMYFEEHPKLQGKNVKLVFEDSHCNGQAAASAGQKLLSNKNIKAIFGATCSGETLAVAPLTEKNKVVLFSSVSTSPELTTAGDYLFRNAPSDEKSSDVAAEDIAKKYKKVALISQNNDFAQAYRIKLKDKLAKAGVEVVIDETFNTGTTDFKTVLQKVKTSGAELLVNYAGESAPAGLISKQAFELGLNLPVYGNDVMLGSEFFEIAKNAADGTRIVAVDADTTTPGAQELLAAYEKKYGGEPAAKAYFILSYDRAAILAKAIEAVGYDADKIRDWLYAMPAYEGLGGSTKFDANGDSTILPKILVATDGEFKMVQE